MHQKRRSYKFNFHWIIILLYLFTASCNPTKYLDIDEALVKKNVVKIESNEKIKNKKNLAENLGSLAKQKPNGRFIGIHRSWYYFKTSQAADTHKFANWIKRVFGEKPIIFNENLANASAETMQFYLENKGYFNAEVYYDKKIKNKKASVFYYVNPGKRYTVDTTIFISKDDNIQRFLNDTRHESYLKKGAPVDKKLYDKEVNRITSKLQNLGYANFHANYIDQLRADSSNFLVTDTLEIFPYKDSIHHPQFHIGEIYIYPYYTPATTPIFSEDSLVLGHHFITSDQQQKVDPEVIIQNIYLKKGQLYSEDNFRKTNQQLGGLGIYKFVSIKSEEDKENPHQLNFYIYLTPNKQMVLGGDVEFNVTNSVLQGNLIGTSASLSYRNRNMFKGAELFIGSVEWGGEFNPNIIAGGGRIFNSIDINPQMDLYFPKFSDLFGVAQLLHGIKLGAIKNNGKSHSLRLLSDNFYELLLEKSVTRLSVGYNYLKRRDFWGYHSFSASFGYDVQNTPSKRFTFTPIGVNYLNPTIDSLGQIIINDNQFLNNSFNNKQLFTGFLFRNFSFTFTGKPNEIGQRWYFKAATELSGAEILGLNSLFNLLSNNNDPFRLFNQIEYAQYFKLELDTRFYKQLTAKRSWVFRLYSGIAFPYGPYSKEVPYVKQFFVGGPNSIRAWNIRELGPGSYKNPVTPASNQPFYQTGTAKLEFNIEYRFFLAKIYSLRLEGAIFLDGGNIWTLKDDSQRPGAKISTDFLKQTALGTGFGFRNDFSYFILTFDVGYPLRNPFPNQNGSHWEDLRWKNNKLKGFNYNLSLGYPF